MTSWLPAEAWPSGNSLRTELAIVAQTLIWALLRGPAEGGPAGGSVVLSKVNI